jgi:phage antirepressor YoqD-like protein
VCFRGGTRIASCLQQGVRGREAVGFLRAIASRPPNPQIAAPLEAALHTKGRGTVMPDSNPTPSRFDNSTTDVAVFGSVGEPTMSSREIADLCETRHNQVVETIVRLFEKGVLRESRKTTRTHQPTGGGRPTEVYDLTKRDTLVVVSGYNDELRARIIDRWQELEARPAINPVAMLNDPAAMRGILLSYTEKVLELQGRVEEMEPQVQALERIAISDGSLCITDAAKTLQVQPKALFSFLKAHGWIYTRQGDNAYIAYQSKLQTGLLEHKTTVVTRSDGSEKTTTQVRVTPKGLTRLAKEFPPVAQAA